MHKMAFVTALFLIAPVLCAQQNRATDDPPQAETQAGPQATSETPTAQESLPAAIRPGHPLDPADVDILTGKRDRENEASRRAGVTILVDGYGAYGGLYATDRRLGAAENIPLLPLAPITRSFFFPGLSPRGFGRGRFRGGR